MISITTKLFDVDGYLLLNNASINVTERRRASISETLDGNAIYDDAGYSSADSNYTIRVTRPTQAEINKARYLLSAHAHHQLSANGYFFTGVLSSVSQSTDNLTMTFKALTAITL